MGFGGDARERSLDEIATEYERSEVTVLWAHDRASSTHRILFGAVELCPAEQPASLPFSALATNGERVSMERATLGPQGKGKLYVTRSFELSAADALKFYRGSSAGRELRIDSSQIRFLPTPLFGEEPPREHPLVITTGDTSKDTYGILPGRAALRVCSLFARGHETLAAFTEKERSVVREFSLQTLGFDLVRHYEHLGAMHLLLPNSILRGWDAALAADENAILLDFFERDGKQVDGCTLRLTDVRTGGIGFDRSFAITSSRMVIPTPYPAGALTYRLYDPSQPNSRRSP